MVESADSARGRGTRRAVAGVLVVAGAVLANGCSGTLEDVFPKRQPSYKSSRSDAPLEVPPELAQSALGDSLPISEGESTYSQYASGTGGAGAQSATPVLPDADDVRIERSGQERWLVVAAAPETVWPRLRDFWIDQGFSLATQDPAIGVMETDWAEKHVPLPAGAIKRALNELTDALYGVAFRDQFRTRMEHGAEPDTTEVYISHRGAEQMVVGDESTYAKREGLGERVWQPRPSDAGLEAEMLTRLMVFLGVEESRAEALAAEGAPQASRAEIVSGADGSMSLSLGEDFSRAWRRVGQALDRGGFAVEDRDRSRGVFFVRYAGADVQEQAGWLSRLKFWGDDDDAGRDRAYLIQLVEEDADTTRLVVLDGDGEREAGPTGNRILTVLHEQLQ